MSQTFQPKNENFVCAHCGRNVAMAAVGYRNHCPFCLYGLHVDIHPGDRANTCRGLLRPVGLEKDSKREWMIVFQCETCGVRARNKAAHDDNSELLISLSRFPT